jgi:hypothetical protein
MSSTSATNRRSFLARGAALAAVPAIATLVGGAVAEPAFADTVPDYAPIPPSALGPAVNAQGYYVGDGLRRPPRSSQRARSAGSRTAIVATVCGALVSRGRGRG